MSKIPDLKFYKFGPFYNMVTAFMSAIAGIEAIMDPRNPMNYHRDGPGIKLEGIVREKLVYNIYDIYQKVITKEIDLVILTSSLCCMLINTAYESVKNKNDHSPQFEFFRHIRNACSHGNQFFFKRQEPKRNAEWRGKKIEHNKKGSNNPLSGTKVFFDYIGSADAILLLWDIEQLLYKTDQSN